ncbi:YobA family protein [Paenibacillus sp. Dod16]|uniref:YobA family protein n=1 Tax=unclassified Paenibacillus TaxID=185978 RepID=UPI0021A2B5F9|nr:YobA family protein [Paenibacillus sp. p3-SID867]MCT1403738.1 YobA family protein [Paenibacillus sp. p3-SID867]
MNFKKIIITCLIIICSAGCGNIEQTSNPENNSKVIEGDEVKVTPDISGYIVDISDNRILVVGGEIVEEDLNKLSINEILTKASPDATWLIIPEGQKLDDYSVGNQVDVWTTGKIDTSYPAQGKATKIVIESE